MLDVFDPDTGATVAVDDQKNVTGISHLGAHWVSDQKTPRDTAVKYVRSLAGLLKVPADWLRNMNEPVSYRVPADRSVEYHFSEEKTSFDSTTVEFKQTVLNIPVWNAGISVTIKHGPYRVVGAVRTGHDHPTATMPRQETVDRYRRLFAIADAERALRTIDFKSLPDLEPLVQGRDSETATFVRGLTAPDDRSRPKPTDDGARLIRGRFYVYRFDPETRLANRRDRKHDDATDDSNLAPQLQLSSLPSAIQPGDYYVVAETTFEYRTSPGQSMIWRALVELESEAVLYLRPLAAGIDGMVFRMDPISATGNTTLTADQSNAVLNPLRTNLSLANLSPPQGGTQSLSGAHAKVVDRDGPSIVAPTEPAGSTFTYDVRTNDFAAVNAYYHVDQFFETMRSLGFSTDNYFKHSEFPLAVDHRGKIYTSGIELGSYCHGNGDRGIDRVSFALNDLTITTNPVGRACDSRATWHELGGHGTLLEHVDDLNFYFAHSAGDSLSAIFHDPGSNAPDRHDLRPWYPSNSRRSDRDVSVGWAWDGSKDDDPYDSEQILTTTLFRAYLSIGGASTDLAGRQFASRLMMYLIFRAIENLMPSSNPKTPYAFAKALMEADALNWTSEGIFGGAYRKVIRWSFEKQGLYQAPGTARPITGPGLPPPVDVYIDDGRGGEYKYQPMHWNTTAIWNRRTADGIPTHEPPLPGQANFAYVKIRNRGTETAHNVRVKGFHCRPSAGLLWPTDFQPMTTSQITVGSVAANNAQEKIAGPFSWTPVANGAGHDCLLMVSSASDDPSNIDSFISGEVIQDWRLVPNDNNIGLRSVTLVSGSSGSNLISSLNSANFWFGNPHNRRAATELRAVVPQWLSAAGWRLGFQGIPEPRFDLGPGEQRQVAIDLQPGTNFDRADVERTPERDLRIEVYADGLLIGGMTYRLEPGL